MVVEFDSYSSSHSENIVAVLSKLGFNHQQDFCLHPTTTSEHVTKSVHIVWLDDEKFIQAKMALS